MILMTFLFKKLISLHFQVPVYLHESFIMRHLRWDGVFMIRLLAAHAGDVIAMEVTRQILFHYRDQEVMHTAGQARPTELINNEHAKSLQFVEQIQ